MDPSQILDVELQFASWPSLGRNIISHLRQSDFSSTQNSKNNIEYKLTTLDDMLNDARSWFLMCREKQSKEQKL